MALIEVYKVLLGYDGSNHAASKPLLAGQPCPELKGLPPPLWEACNSLHSRCGLFHLFRPRPTGPSPDPNGWQAQVAQE